ncbi:MAG: sulfotransferase [Hyphomicrobiaceae bacterium]
MARLPGATNPPALKSAIARYNAGDLKGAQKELKRILGSHPSNADANHLMGLVALDSGSPPDAVKLISRSIAANGRNALALSNLGRAYKASGRIDEAIASYRRALAIEPRNPGILNNLGIALTDRDEAAEALQVLTTAGEISPDSPMVLTNLGNALRALQRLDEAVAAYRRAIGRDPRYLPALTNLGRALEEKGEPNEALGAFEAAFKIAPDDGETLRGLSGVLCRLERTRDALPLLERARRLDPADLATLLSLSKAQTDLGLLDEALETAREMIRLDPSIVEAHSVVAMVLTAYGNVENALAARRRALEVAPGDVVTHCQLGETLLAADRKAEAVAAYRAALALDPEDTRTIRHLVFAERHRSMTPEIEHLVARYDNEAMEDGQRMELGFALARVFEQLGDHDRAFRYLSEANGLQRKTFDYSTEIAADYFARIRQVFTRDFFARTAGAGLADARPIFVLGMPRSGTTLTEQIIASHPDVRGAGELTDLGAVMVLAGHGRNQIVYPETIASLDGAGLEGLGRAYMERIWRRHGSRQRFTDKMPQNFERVGLIRAMLPNAVVIHCRRDPLDNCLSIYKNFFAVGHQYACDLAELGHRHRLYQDLMAHWSEVLPGFVYDLDYERLIADQEGETRRLIAHCGLEWNDACLDFHRAGNVVMTISTTQVRQPIYRDSVAQWRRYEAHLGPLKAALGIG